MSNKEDLNQSLAYVSYYGVKIPVCPATKEELLADGATPVEYDPAYVEDEKAFNKYQKATLLGIDNHLLIIGPTGSGKDQFVRQMAAKSNSPLAYFNFNSSGDASGWITRTTLTKDEGVTVTEEQMGALRKACQGLTIYRDLKSLYPSSTQLLDLQRLIAEMESHKWRVEKAGSFYKITIPYKIGIADVDRAGYEMMEAIRQAIENGKEMLTDPITGEMFNVFPGTRFFFTGNSGVDGDGGRGMIITQKDASIANRMSAIRVDHPSEKIEKAIYAKANPQLAEEHIDKIVKCTVALRQVCRQESLPLDISMRQGLAWIAHSLRFQSFYNVSFVKALEESFDALTGHFMDDENVELFKSAVSAFLTEDTTKERKQYNPSNCPIDN